MIIGLANLAEEYRGTIQDIIWLFYPGAQLVTDSEATLVLSLTLGEQGKSLWAEAELYGEGSALAHRETGEPILPGEAANEQKRLARLAVYQVLASFCGENPSPWGIMTGIRPTKVIHRLLDLGWGSEQVEGFLKSKYALAPEKASLITDIARSQRPFLLSPEQAAKMVAVYIGIPFCPTRCLYCSFPSYPIDKHRAMVAPFLQALLEEIRVVGETLQSSGLTVQSIYLGGGTPTSLHCEQLKPLLQVINQHLRNEETLEYTVEGGRPDTLTEEILGVLNEHRVTRLSINPQSMNQKTLEAIGRSHSVEDIYQAVEAARRFHFDNINMDVIIGLPGETLQEVAHTMQCLATMQPENLTVHALALKRASHLKQRLAEFPLPGASEATAMWQETARVAGEMGLEPYYMYRQKQMVGNLENIGYALPGHQCVYNIQMIEERQTIIGLGVGAGSKWVDPRTWTLVNEYNAKETRQYVDRLDEYLERKIKHIQGLAVN